MTDTELPSASWSYAREIDLILYLRFVPDDESGPVVHADAGGGLERLGGPALGGDEEGQRDYRAMAGAPVASLRGPAQDDLDRGNSGERVYAGGPHRGVSAVYSEV